MPTLRNISERLIAALTFFTRLPLVGKKGVEAEAYRHVVPLWPLMGWLTGGVIMAVYLLAQLAGLDKTVSVILAILSRVILTGALHEDGLADFCDGFGGGRTRKRTLEIMKDSHIGTYGVLGLVGYSLLSVHVLASLMNQGFSPFLFVIADVACKFCASTIVWFLPYARSSEEAKNGFEYSDTPVGEKVFSLIVGVSPIGVAGFLIPDLPLLHILICFVASCVVCALMFLFMRRRIGGYTGDCCGATFLLAELMFYVCLTILVSK